jgi:hypothetical protein
MCCKRAVPASAQCATGPMDRKKAVPTSAQFTAGNIERTRAESLQE